MNRSLDIKISFGRSNKKTFYLSIGDRCIKFRERYNFEQSTKKTLSWRDTKRSGLYTESKLPLPFNSIVTLVEMKKTYAEAVGYKAPDIDWMIDEFDSSFNALAVASLKYHQDWAVTYCSDERRAKYQDLIDRLSTRSPGLTDEEREILYPPGEDLFTPNEDGSFSTREYTEEQQAVSDAWMQRRQDHRDMIQKARQDFIEVLPGLWS